MPVVLESIAVEAPVGVVSGLWPYFVDWILVGEHKLLCTELACVSAAHDGHVNFESLDRQRTTVVFQIDPEGTGIADELLGHRLRQDLALFKKYVEEKRLSRRERHRLEKAGRAADPHKAK